MYHLRVTIPRCYSRAEMLKNYSNNTHISIESNNAQVLLQSKNTHVLYTIPTNQFEKHLPLEDYASYYEN